MEAYLHPLLFWLSTLLTSTRRDLRTISPQDKPHSRVGPVALREPTRLHVILWPQQFSSSFLFNPLRSLPVQFVPPCHIQSKEWSESVQTWSSVDPIFVPTRRALALVHVIGSESPHRHSDPHIHLGPTPASPPISRRPLIHPAPLDSSSHYWARQVCTISVRHNY